MRLNTLTNNIFTIDGFWTPQACEDFIRKSELIGYELATVGTESTQIVLETVRNNSRVIHNDVLLAEQIWEHLKPMAPPKIGNSKAVGLNEVFRFYKYQPGQQFKRHRDQSYIRNDIEASYFTFMIYLNDDFEGGETSFANVAVQPTQGTALLFLHDLEHEGSAVKKGTKYVLRSDIMYRLQLNNS